MSGRPSPKSILDTKTSRRNLLRGAAGVSAFGLLAACSGGGGSGGSKTLKIQESFNLPTATKVLRKFADEFERSHKGVKIQITNVPYANLVSTGLAAFSAGNLPDIMQASSAIGSVNFSQLGMFVDLKDLISDKVKSNFVEGSFQEIGMLGLPVIQSPEEGIWYLKDAFDSAGIKPPPVTEAWTWDEMVKAAKKLTNAPSQYGFVERGQTAVMGKSLIPYGWSFGTDWITGEKGSWKSGATSSAMNDAMSLYVALTRRDKVRPKSYLSWGLPQAEKAWAKKQMAMFSSGMWWSGDADQTSKMRFGKDYDVMLFPTDDPKNRAVYTGFDYFHITKNAKDPQLAAEFLEFMFTGTKIADLEHADVNLPPMTKSNLADPRYKADKFPLWAERFSKWLPYDRTLSTNPHYSDVMTNTIVPAVQGMVQSGSSVPTGLKKLDTAITTKIRS